MHKKLLVCGCPRSGTMYTSLVLGELDVKAGHMIMGEDGIVDYALTALGEEGSGFELASSEGLPSGGINGVTFGTIFHQVRHPIAVIRSIQTMNGLDAFWNFVGNHVQLKLDESADISLRLAEFWIRWNEKSEVLADWSYPIEELSNPNGIVYMDFCGWLQVKPKWKFSCDTLPDVNSHSDYDTYGKVTWKQILEADEELFEEMLETMLRYGYTLNTCKGRDIFGGERNEKISLFGV